MTTIPIEHLKDAQKLTADAQVDLWEVVLRKNQGTIYLSSGMNVTWQGHSYDSTPILLGAEKQSSDEEVSRPPLTIFNPENVFASFVVTRILEKSIVKRKRLLKANLDADLPIFEQKTWFIGRVTSFVRGTLTVELRNLLDGPNFTMPRRQYIPPDFPTVSLQ